VLRRFGFAIFFLKGDENDTVKGQHIIIIVTFVVLEPGQSLPLVLTASSLPS
jgi:hypothetical protein